MIDEKEFLKRIERNQKKAKYKVAICVTCYNQEEYIGAALDSLLSQKTNFSFLIVVGDDYSTDNSRKILKQYEQRYPNKIKVIYHTENKGLVANRKEIFRLLDSEYVAFCDGDDYWIDDECLQRKVNFLDKNRQYIGYQTACNIRKGNEISKISDLEERDCFYDFTKENALHNEYLGLVDGFFFRNVYKCMEAEVFEKYTGYPIDDSGKLPIFAGVLAPIYRQDKKETCIYRYIDNSMERKLSKKNRCKDLFLSHLIYRDMIQEFFGTYQMEIDDQLMVLIVNSFITAVKSTFTKSGKENWEEHFLFLYNYGFFAKRKIRQAIYVHIKQKFVEKIKSCFE